MNIGLIEGDVCGRDSCDGLMHEQDNGTCCSCHINPPCSHCTDMTFECDKCGEETEKPECDPVSAKPYSGIPEQYKRRKTDKQMFDELPDNEFGYITIPGQYYWMEYKGKYPKEMPASDIVAKFNTCFGYKWLKIPSDGTFHLKLYTD